MLSIEELATKFPNDYKELSEEFYVLSLILYTQQIL